jgi:hypothetical protein
MDRAAKAKDKNKKKTKREVKRQRSKKESIIGYSLFFSSNLE